MADYRCPYGYGWCEVPYKDCPHWQGTFCELDVEARRMAELKPCPFCGGKDSGMLTTSYDGYWFAVFCENCMVQTRKCRQEKDAIEAWNRCAGEEDKHELVERQIHKQ